MCRPAITPIDMPIIDKLLSFIDNYVMLEGGTLMKPHTIIARVVLVIFGLGIVLSWLLLWSESDYSAAVWPEMAHLQYPILVGSIIATLPFLAILIIAYQFLLLVERRTVFTHRALTLIGRAQWVCIAATIYYVSATIWFMCVSPLQHISILLMAIFMVTLSAGGTVFFLVTGHIFRAAIAAWDENQLTV